MVQATSEILELTGRLHEGAVDDEVWKAALDSACRMIGTAGLLLGVVEKGRLGSLLGHRLPDEAIALLYESLGTADSNPWVGAAATQALRRPVTVDDLGGQAAIERTRLWRDLNRPFGIGECAGAVLERQPGTADIVTVGRAVGMGGFEPAQIRAFAGLIPHLARVWRVKRTLAEWKAMAGTLTFILDRLERAVVVAGPEGEVRFANRAADRLLSRGDALDATRGRLRAARPHHTAALASLIERASMTGAGAAATAVDAVSIPCAGEGAAVAVVAEPLASAHSDCLGHSAKPGAVLFIGDSQASTRPPAERLRIVYNLTPAEARLTALVVDGCGIASAARSLGVSPNTVKYHLKAIFGKVGASSRSQLVRRVLADVGGLAEPEKMIPAAAGLPASPRR
jgi:DNA-binding CsgD family transcriptional regulator